MRIDVFESLLWLSSPDTLHKLPTVRYLRHAVDLLSISEGNNAVYVVAGPHAKYC